MHIKLVNQAKRYIESKWKGITGTKFEREKEDVFLEFLPRLRGMLSEQNKKILTGTTLMRQLAFQLVKRPSDSLASVPQHQTCW